MLKNIIGPTNLLKCVISHAIAQPVQPRKYLNKATVFAHVP